MITLPRWIARLPWIRSRIFHPKLTLRGDSTHVERYGLMPGGAERSYGSTVEKNLDQAREAYSYDLWLLEVNVCAPVQVEGSDCYPLPPLKTREVA